ncbi:putative primase/helicase [Pseudomonas phage PIP]|nr:putative primase/helicase [Pseudomonas phage PIP]
MHSGISSLVRACTSNMPTFHNFIGLPDLRRILHSSGHAPAIRLSWMCPVDWGSSSSGWYGGQDSLSTLRTPLVDLYPVHFNPLSAVSEYSDKD